MYWWYHYPFQRAVRNFILLFDLVIDAAMCSVMKTLFTLRLLVTFSKQLKYYLTDILTLNLLMLLPAFHMWTIIIACVQDEHLRHRTEKHLINKVIEFIKLEPEFNPIHLIPIPGLFLLHQYSFSS